MDTSPQPASFSSDRDEPLTPEEGPNESTIQKNLTSQHPYVQDSGRSSSGRIRRWSEPQDDTIPLSPMFKPLHRRHLSMPVTPRSRSDPRSVSVYKWLDAIAEAGGVEPLGNVPFHSPSHANLPSLKTPGTVENWEYMIEEESVGSPTDDVDPDIVNLGISKSGNTVMSDDMLDTYFVVEDTESNKDTPRKMDTAL